MLLAIDTSTLEAGVALVALDGRLLAARRARVTVHSERLLGLVEETVEAAGIRLSDLVAIGCGAGPGSFTGLRIGMATAKGLCLALQRPLILVSSLAALAARAPVPSLSVGCIDAFKGEVYAGLYPRPVDGAAAGNAALHNFPLDAKAVEEMVVAPEQLARVLAERVKGGALPVHLVGDVFERWPILDLAGVHTADRAPPDAADVARLALARHLRGERDDLGAAVPRYIRPSEAELLFGRRDS